MVLQAEGIRYGVEHWRRNRERVSGTLIWQLNDCWPVASWSSIDYFGRWKALHYAARKFYAPILLSVEDKAEQMGLFVTNDTTKAWTGEVRWSLETLAGERLDQGSENVSAAALAATPVRRLDFSGHINDENRRQVVFIAELWKGKSFLARQVATFAPNKHLELVEPQIETKASIAGEQLTVQIESKLPGALCGVGTGRSGCGLQRQLLRPAGRADSDRYLPAAGGLDARTGQGGAAGPFAVRQLLKTETKRADEFARAARACWQRQPTQPHPAGHTGCVLQSQAGWPGMRAFVNGDGEEEQNPRQGISPEMPHTGRLPTEGLALLRRSKEQTGSA